MVPAAHWRTRYFRCYLATLGCKGQRTHFPAATTTSLSSCPGRLVAADVKAQKTQRNLAPCGGAWKEPQPTKAINRSGFFRCEEHKPYKTKQQSHPKPRLHIAQKKTLCEEQPVLWTVPELRYTQQRVESRPHPADWGTTTRSVPIRFSGLPSPDRRVQAAVSGMTQDRLLPHTPEHTCFFNGTFTRIGP